MTSSISKFHLIAESSLTKLWIQGFKIPDAFQFITRFWLGKLASYHRTKTFLCRFYLFSSKNGYTRKDIPTQVGKDVFTEKAWFHEDIYVLSGCMKE